MGLIQERREDVKGMLNSYTLFFSVLSMCQALCLALYYIILFKPHNDCVRILVTLLLFLVYWWENRNLKKFSNKHLNPGDAELLNKDLSSVKRERCFRDSSRTVVIYEGTSSSIISLHCWVRIYCLISGSHAHTNTFFFFIWALKSLNCLYA